METISLEKLNNNISSLREIVEKMSEVILEDSLEISDEVIMEIEESRKRPVESFVSQEDVEAEFLNGN